MTVCHVHYACPMRDGQNPTEGRDGQYSMLGQEKGGGGAVKCTYNLVGLGGGGGGGVRLHKSPSCMGPILTI